MLVATHREAPRRPGSASAPSLFAPAALPRPKSALNLRIKGQLSQVKSMANLVRHGGASSTLEDLTTGKLLLDRDSKLHVKKTAEERKAEMFQITQAVQRKYDRQRLVSDAKEAALAKMVHELTELESFKARLEAASSKKDVELARLDDVREEVRVAEASMEEAVGYTESLQMMTHRLRFDIQTRTKLQYELDRNIAELRRELNVVATHQRTLRAAER